MATKRQNVFFVGDRRQSDILCVETAKAGEVDKGDINYYINNLYILYIYYNIYIIYINLS